MGKVVKITKPRIAIEIIFKKIVDESQKIILFLFLRSLTKRMDVPKTKITVNKNE